MTTATSLITSAYREGNLIPVGTTPTVNEQNEALERLNRIIQGTFGHEMGEPLMDWLVPAPQRTAPIAANYPQLPYPQGLDADLLTTPFAFDQTSNIFQFPPRNSRIVWGNVSFTAYFPEMPNDGSRMAIVQGSGAGDGGQPAQTLTLNGNGRTIQGSNTQALASPLTPTEWVYRADLADWQKVQDMALNDNCIFPPEHDDLWIVWLAIRLAPRYGKTISPETDQVGLTALKRFQARYRQDAPTTYGSNEFPRSLQSYISGRWFY